MRIIGCSSRSGALAATLGWAAVAGGCAAPRTAGPGDASIPAAASSAGEPLAPPVIQIRDFPGSALIAVLVWSPEEPWFGLRGHVNRSGEVVGAHRIGDHRLFVAATYANELGGFMRASVVPVPPGPVLLTQGPRADAEACNRTDVCAPSPVYVIQVPDELVRQRDDSLVVTFTGGRYREWSIPLRPELIATYLRVVDSVAAAR